jgi:hypothetical protein
MHWSDCPFLRRPASEKPRGGGRVTISTRKTDYTPTGEATRCAQKFFFVTKAKGVLIQGGAATSLIASLAKTCIDVSLLGRQCRNRHRPSDRQREVGRWPEIDLETTIRLDLWRAHQSHLVLRQSRRSERHARGQPDLYPAIPRAHLEGFHDASPQ